MRYYMKDGSEVLSFKRVTALMESVVVVAVLLVAIPSLVSAGGKQLKAKALLRPVNASVISGSVTIKEDDSGVTVKGKAQGLDPFAAGGYISLFYDIDSVSTGPDPCVAALSMGEPGDLTGPEMGTGGQLVWDVSSKGRGSLDGMVDVGIDRIRTISIRACDGTCAPPNPLQACGLIVID